MTSSRVALERVAAFGRNANPVARFRRGSGSLFNISIYTVGMSGVWTGYGSILLQFKATEIAAGDGVSMVGWTLDKTALAAFHLVDRVGDRGGCSAAGGCAERPPGWDGVVAALSVHHLGDVGAGGFDADVRFCEQLFGVAAGDCGDAGYG